MLNTKKEVGLTIKRKDGTIFRLRGPNPIMDEQEIWNGKDFKLHNFDSDEEHVQMAPKIKFEGMNFENLTEIEPEEITVEIKETPVPPEVKPKQPRPPKSRNLIKVYCLPASFEQVTDSVYGDVKTTLSYGEQFQFECELVSADDLTCVVKTNLTGVEKQSIIFFPAERRWWKVVGVEHNNNGLFLTCMPSDIQPSFT